MLVSRPARRNRWMGCHGRSDGGDGVVGRSDRGSAGGVGGSTGIGSGTGSGIGGGGSDRSGDGAGGVGGVVARSVAVSEASWEGVSPRSPGRYGSIR